MAEHTIAGGTGGGATAAIQSGNHQHHGPALELRKTYRSPSVAAIRRR